MEKIILNGYEFVDMGTNGVFWATCNLGASSPEEYGNYYAWGEITTKADYSEKNWAHGNYDYDELCDKGIVTYTGIRYDEDSPINSRGNKYTMLEKEFDVVNKECGGNCYIPEYDDFVVLLMECETSLYETNGVKGLLFKSKVTGNTLFFPFCGTMAEDALEDNGVEGGYWTSTAECSDNVDPDCFYNPNFLSVSNANKSLARARLDIGDYFWGRCIRPCMKL